MGSWRLFVARPLPVDPRALVGPDVEAEMFAEDRPPTPAELYAAAADADGVVALLSDRIDVAFFEQCPRVRIVANYAVGYDNVDVEAATARGVWITNTPDVLTDATADLTWTLILALARRVREGERLARTGDFGGWSPTMLRGMELHGARLGVYGFGRIGRAVARRARGFGMQTSYVSRSRAPREVERELDAHPVDMRTLLGESDVISIHAPLTAETLHAFGSEQLARMQRHALLINTARGPIVDEGALVNALEEGMLGGAGLDVYEDEPRVHPGLVERDDVVLLPHIGSATHSTRRRMAEMALRNADAAIRGNTPPNAVNTPALRSR